MKRNLNNIKYIKDNNDINNKLYLNTYLSKISEFNLNKKNKKKIILAFYNLIDNQFYLCENQILTDCNINELNSDQRKKISFKRKAYDK